MRRWFYLKSTCINQPWIICKNMQKCWRKHAPARCRPIPAQLVLSHLIITILLHFIAWLLGCQAAMLLPIATWRYIPPLNHHQSAAWTVGGGLVNNCEEPFLAWLIVSSCPPPSQKSSHFCLLPLALAAVAVAGRPFTSPPQRAFSLIISPPSSATSKDLIPGCDTSPTLSQPVPTITFK